MLVFGGQGFNFTGRARHLVNGIDHRLVVVRHRQVVLRLGDIQIRIQPAAVEDRQRQPRGDAHLLSGGTEEIAQMQGILLQECHQVHVGIEGGFGRIHFAQGSFNVPVRLLQIRAAGQQFVSQRGGQCRFRCR